MCVYYVYMSDKVMKKATAQKAAFKQTYLLNLCIYFSESSLRFVCAGNFKWIKIKMECPIERKKSIDLNLNRRRQSKRGSPIL